MAAQHKYLSDTDPGIPADIMGNYIELGLQACKLLAWNTKHNLLIIIVIIMWPEKFDFVFVPEHDVTGILT